MKVKELIEQLKQYDKELRVTVMGCYQSTGDIEAVIYNDLDKKPSCVVHYDRQEVLLISDICSG